VADLELVSIITPAYNEAATLPLFYQALIEALTPLETSVRFEFLFVNNGSTDRTLAILEELRRADPRVQIATLSRNFGYQAAITAGLRLARGGAAACIDADGEDPPHVLAKFVQTWLRGEADVVYGIRGKRPESALMQLARKFYYRLTRAVADHEILLDMAEFALLDRRALDAVLCTRSTFPFVRGQVGYVGFRRVGIPYDRERRLGGKSHYNLFRAFQFGLGGILSSSTFPLRLLAYGAVAALPLALVAVVVAIVLAWRSGGMNSVFLLVVLSTVLVTWIVFGIGVLSIYLARAYKDKVGLPLFVLDWSRSALTDRVPEPPARLVR
jgi:polyisoprenyl-phosphate glycosyltransferase